MVVSFLSPFEAQQALAQKIRVRREQMHHSRKQAAEITGVPEPTLRRFEDTGEISLRQFLMLVCAYGSLSEVLSSIKEAEAQSIAELIEKKGAR